MIRHATPLRREERGTTIVEFAIIAPALILLIIGGMELGHIGYIKGITRAALQVAARDSGLETGIANKTAIDNRVRERIKTVIPNARVDVDRRSYTDFSSVGTPEDFNDGNGNGIYDADECFTDMNNNGRWDSDRGRANDQGGADEVTLYTVRVTYDKVFPLWALVGQPKTNVLTAQTTMRNQPYGVQAGRTGVRTCP